MAGDSLIDTCEIQIIFFGFCFIGFSHFTRAQGQDSLLAYYALHIKWAVQYPATADIIPNEVLKLRMNQSKKDNFSKDTFIVVDSITNLLNFKTNAGGYFYSSTKRLKNTNRLSEKNKAEIKQKIISGFAQQGKASVDFTTNLIDDKAFEVMRVRLVLLNNETRNIDEYTIIKDSCLLTVTLIYDNQTDKQLLESTLFSSKLD